MTAQGNCKLSVLLSVFNGEPFLARAVESILAQTEGDFEFLITDDGSTDATFSILSDYAQQDRRIVLCRQDKKGLTESLNRMISRAQGRFIARMDADDISHPMRFKEQLAYLNRRPDCLVVGCWIQRIDEHDQAILEMRYPDSHKKLEQLLHSRHNCFTHGSVMLRRKVFEELGLFYRFRYGQDFDLWLRMAELGGLGLVPRILYRFREHPSKISYQVKNARRHLVELQMQLAHERRTSGRESTEWQSREADILRGWPIQAPATATDNSYKYYRALIDLYSGQTRAARAQMKSLGKTGLIYVATYLPAGIVLMFVCLRRLLFADWRYLRIVRPREQKSWLECR